MSKAWLITSLALAAALSMQTIRVADLKTDLAKAESAQAKTAQAQAQQEKEATESKASALLGHAGNQQDNIYEYTQTIQRLETGRSADAARIASLQQQLRTTATAHAQAAGDAAAARDLADHYRRLAEALAEGAGVVGELVALVERRDAQVILLKGQVQTERRLVEGLAGQ